VSDLVLSSSYRFRSPLLTNNQFNLFYFEVSKNVLKKSYDPLTIKIKIRVHKKFIRSS
jgi:hypothetical protein